MAGEILYVIRPKSDAYFLVRFYRGSRHVFLLFVVIVIISFPDQIAEKVPYKGPSDLSNKIIHYFSPISIERLALPESTVLYFDSL